MSSEANEKGAVESVNETRNDRSERPGPKPSASSESGSASSSVSPANDDKAAGSSRKRPALKEAQSSAPKRQAQRDGLTDTAVLCGYAAGDRFDVEWELDFEDDSEESPQDDPTPPQTVWWGATLLEFDGTVMDDVVVRILEYDPRPDLGFPEAAREYVVFTNIGTLFHVQADSAVEMRYRKEGAHDTEISMSSQAINDVLDSTIINAQKKVGWSSLNAAQQAELASKIATSKELLSEKMLELTKENRGQLITAEHVQSVLADAARELQERQDRDEH